MNGTDDGLVPLSNLREQPFESVDTPSLARCHGAGNRCQKTIAALRYTTMDQTKEITFWAGDNVLPHVAVLEIRHDYEGSVVQYVCP